MSKANKQQRSIDSFFKNPAPTKAKPVKQEEPEPVAAPMEDERPPPQPPSKAKPAPPSPKKPTVIAPSPPPAPVRTATHDTEWINLSERFLLNNRNFDVQYAHLYAERLGSMRKIVSQAAENRWGTTTVPMKKMNDLILDEECILIGILFKQMVLKPSIVKQLAAENGFNLQPPRKRYVDATDQLILEEESQRIVLNGNLDINHFVTGVVIAVLGHEDDKGMFIVKEYCFKEMSIPKPLNSSSEDKYVLFASGFLLSETSVIFNQLEYLTKSLTKPEEIQSEKLRDVFQNLVRVVVAGNLIENSNRLKESTNQAKYLTRKLAANSVEAMHSIDELFDKISAITDIDVMPGVNDPSCHMLPQQPLHPCMFPSASKRKTTHCLTNPYDFQIGELRFLGTSGQNIDDIDLQSTFDNRLDILEHILRWGVIAPTCPDTLSCYPYVKNDPFIIHHTPNLFFAGNQPKYETRLFQDSNGIEVRLLAIPQFAQSSSCVAVNLRNFECLEISFEKETIEICAP